MLGSRRLCGCLLNVSEAKSKKIVHEIIESALTINTSVDEHHVGAQINLKDDEKEKKIVTSVLNVFSDFDYNRSVITIVSYPEYMAKSVINACVTANELIDVSNQNGGHPRLGAVDLIPIHPLSSDVSLEECGRIAVEIANGIDYLVNGASSFLFGHADIPLKRGLVQRRKEMNWYSGKYGESVSCIPDIGSSVNPRYGITGIGAIPYMMNCNVTIQTNNLDIGREIATDIRSVSSHGFPGVQSMAFHHDGNVEIACNISGLYFEEEEKKDLLKKSMEEKYSNATHEMKNRGTYFSPMLCSFGKYFHVPPATLEAKISYLASITNIKTIGPASIIGFTPEEAHKLSLHAIEYNLPNFWKTRLKTSM